MAVPRRATPRPCRNTRFSASRHCRLVEQGDQIDSRCVKRRDKSEDQGGHKGEDDGEAKYPNVRAHLGEHSNLQGRQKRRQRLTPGVKRRRVNHVRECHRSPNKIKKAAANFRYTHVLNRGCRAVRSPADDRITLPWHTSPLKRMQYACHSTVLRNPNQNVFP